MLQQKCLSYLKKTWQGNKLANLKMGFIFFTNANQSSVCMLIFFMDSEADSSQSSLTFGIEDEASGAFSLASFSFSTRSGNSSLNILFSRLNDTLCSASRRFSASVVSRLPCVGVFSSMKLSSAVRMVETLQAGFHVSGWKLLIDRHSLVLGLNLPFGVIM